MTLALAPYFHPTTIVFVDDNDGFLRSLDLELPGHCAYKVFTDPTAALAFLNEPSTSPTLMDRCFSVDRLKRSAGNYLDIYLDLDLIEEEIKNPLRFARNSVVMIDYSMPLMNGLEFCADLTDPYIQKAMLTGVADERVAVQAFNAQLIDRFIPKNTHHSVSDILAFAEEMQQAYFVQHTARLINTLSIDPPGFLTDVEAARTINRLMSREGVVEYYLVASPPGFLMLRSDGSSLMCTAYDAEQYNRAVAAAEEAGIPSRYREGLANREIMPVFVDALQDHPPDEYPWDDNLIACEVVQGRETWYVGLLNEAPLDIDFERQACSYDSFLATLPRGGLPG